MEQEQEEDLDDTDLLVAYEGVTRDGALQLSFDFDRRSSDSRRSKEGKHSHREHQTEVSPSKDGSQTPSVEDTAEPKDRPAPPKLTVVMMVTGTRGDIQPFMVCALN